MTDTVTDDRRINRLLKWLDKQRTSHLDMVTDTGDSSMWSKEEAELISDHMQTVETMRREIEELDFLRHEGGPQSVAAMEAALKAALPVMRRTAAEYLSSVMIRMDPNTIAPVEWYEVTPDLDAIVAAEAVVGRQPDDPDRLFDSQLMPILDGIIEGRAWEAHR